MKTAQLGLWDLPALPPRRWIPRCDDCGRRIWASAAIHRRFGLLLGDKCHRRRARAARRLAVSVRIHVTNPGHIPGQLTVDAPEER